MVNTECEAKIQLNRKTNRPVGLVSVTVYSGVQDELQSQEVLNSRRSSSEDGVQSEPEWLLVVSVLLFFLFYNVLLMQHVTSY